MGIETLIPAVGGLVGGLFGGGGSKQSGTQTVTQQQQLDPRIAAMLFGNGSDNQGLLSQYQGLLNAPQSDAMKQYGQQAGDYLSQRGASDMNMLHDKAASMLTPQGAPQANAAAPTSAAMLGATPQMQAAQLPGSQSVSPSGMSVLWNTGESFNAPQAMQAAQQAQPGQVAGAQVQTPAAMQAAMAGGTQINAPSQNGMNLTGAYDGFINGQAGANPYLTGAIGKGINQSNNAFSNMQTNATDNLLRNIMPSIRSNAVLAGQYGGSRQGVAEGNAIGDFAKAQQQAISQFGQNNTDAAVAAQAGAYDADRNRALAATQGLGAQQYGVASQNASLGQTTQLANQSAQQQANATNYGGLLSGAMANAGYGQQANLANQSANAAAAANNAQLQQQANSTNYNGQLNTNQQNAAFRQQANLANQNTGMAAEQYNANATNAANLANANFRQSTDQFNATSQQGANQYNTGLQQQSNLANQGAQQQSNLANQGVQQQTNLANLQAQLGTNQLNSNNAMAGMGTLSGLLGNAYTTAGNQDEYALNRAKGVNSLLAPYLSANQSNTTSQPLYQNTGGNILGGALMGKQLFGGGSGGSNMGSIMDLFGSKFMNY